MSRLARMRDSNSDISIEAFADELSHNIASQAFVKPDTVMGILERLESDIFETSLILNIVNEGIERYGSKRRLEKVSSALRTLRGNLENRIRLLGSVNGTSDKVSAVLSGKTSGRPTVLDNLRGPSATTVSKQTQISIPNRGKKGVFHVTEKVEKVLKMTEKKEYVLVSLSEQEGKRIYGAQKYFEKLMGQNYITKSELMSLSDFFARSADYLDRFSGVTDYKAINNIKNRIKGKVNKCGARIPPSDLQEDYDRFMALISQK